MADKDGYEYGIAWTDPKKWTDGSNPHREGMTREEAVTWLREWEDDIRTEGAQFKPDLFAVIRRPMGAWEGYDV